jgi:ParB family chromosome partitioning protein
VRLPIASIEPNPFQSRVHIDQEAVDRLATEIGKLGFWDAALRVRQVGKKHQLVTGHQRMAALQKLGFKTVEVTVVDLNDLQMAQQSLAENSTQHGLPDMDRAEALSRLLQMMMDQGKSRDDAITELCEITGYRSTVTIGEYLDMAGFSERTKQVVRRENMPRTAARIARAIGGEDMVKLAAKEKLDRNVLQPMITSMQHLSEAGRKKVAEKILERKITDPADVRRLAAREMQKQASPEDRMPIELMDLIALWTNDLESWTKRLKEVTKHRAYIQSHPAIAKEFRRAAENFIEALQDLLGL